MKQVLNPHEELIKAHWRGHDHKWDALTIQQRADWFNGQKEFFGTATRISELTLQMT